MITDNVKSLFLKKYVDNVFGFINSSYHVLVQEEDALEKISCVYFQPHEGSVSFDIVLQCVFADFDTFPRDTFQNFKFAVFGFGFAVFKYKDK